MRRHTLFLLLLLAPLLVGGAGSRLCAQKNAKEGFVLLVGGDTIPGLVDDRVASSKSQVCYFCRHGEDTFRAYTPAEILGYFFLHEGRLFVSRQQTMGGTPVKFFAECLLAGRLSLYTFEWDAHTYYLWEQDGYAPILVDAEWLTASPYMVEDERLALLDPLYQTIYASPAATARFHTSGMTREQLVGLARAWNSELSTEEPPYLEFGHRTRSAQRPARFKVFAGAVNMPVCYQMEGGTYSGSDPFPYGRAWALRVGVGCDVYLPRVFEGFMFQGELTFTPFSATIPEYHDHEATMVQEKSHVFNLTAGLAYEVPTGIRLRPLVRAGVGFVASVAQSKGRYEWGDNFNLNLYAGLGLSYRIGRRQQQAVFLTADYKPMCAVRQFNRFFGDNFQPILDVAIGYRF